MSHLRNTAFTSTPYGRGMATFLLRVALPDRPGALGAVASRIGALRADVVAVDIVGRDHGQAVDEFVVEMADERHVSLLMNEIAEVDGVSVEEVRVLPAEAVDRRATAYDTAIAIMAERNPTAVLQVVVERAAAELGATWVAAIDPEVGLITASVGACPAASWLSAYVAGSRWYLPDAVALEPARGQTARGQTARGQTARAEPATASADGPETEPQSKGAAGSAPSPAGLPAAAHAPAGDVAWTALHAWDLVLIAGRPGRVFGQADRLHLTGIGRLADARWTDIANSEARHNHPSARHGAHQMVSSR